MKSGIYCILNLKNGRHYVGSSKDVKSRTMRHFSMLRKGSHHSKILQNAWNKYGEKSFRVDVLESVSETDLIEREQFWISNTRPYYNVHRTAGSPRGHRHSEDSRAKFRAAQAVRDSETNLKIRMANTGKVRSAAAIENYRATYEKKSECQKLAQVEQMRKARKGIPVSGAGKLKIAKVNEREFIVISRNGERSVIQNLAAFCRINKLDRACMTRVSTGELTHHKGWKCINPRLTKEMK